MPNFNNRTYIKEAIESVLAQKYNNWELVIVDDASTDNSLEVIEPFLTNLKIKLIKNVMNKGVAHAAKLAVENSSGEIIGTLDSDDVLYEDALMVMTKEYMANPDYGLIYSNHYIVDKNSAIRGKSKWLDPWPDDTCLQEVFINRLFDKVTISMHFRTFRRSAYNKTEGYDTSLLSYEDRDLYYKLEKVTKIKGINKCLYGYRHNDTMGAFRNNPKIQYYWFICEYKETKRRLGINLPYADREKISPFLSNVMYRYLCKQSNMKKENLRAKLHSLLSVMGYTNLKSNKFLAILYYLNSWAYGNAPITFKAIRKFINPELLGK